MAICTLTQITSLEVGCYKKERKKVGNYQKPKEENKKKLELFLSKYSK
jgi:hypothetical protein